MKWFVLAIKRYAVFSGRSQRSEFWYFELFWIVFGLSGAFGLEIAIIMFGGNPDGAADAAVGLYNLWCLALLIPHLAVTVRRLHDTGRSGWWILISVIPFAGAIILLIFLCEDSEPHENRFGPNPKAVPIEPIQQQAPA